MYKSLKLDFRHQTNSGDLARDLRAKDGQQEQIATHDHLLKRQSCVLLVIIFNRHLAEYLRTCRTMICRR